MKKELSWLNQLENVVYASALVTGITVPIVALTHPSKPSHVLKRDVPVSKYVTDEKPQLIVAFDAPVVTKTAVAEIVLKDNIVEEKPASKPKIKPKTLDDYLPLQGELQSALLKVRFGRVRELQCPELKNLYAALSADPKFQEYRDLFAQEITDQLTKQSASQVIDALDLLETAHDLFSDSPEYRDFNDALTECLSKAIEQYLSDAEPAPDGFLNDVLLSLTEHEGKDNTVTYRTKPLSDNLRMLHAGTWQRLLGQVERFYDGKLRDAGKTVFDRIRDYEETIRAHEEKLIQAEQRNATEEYATISEFLERSKKHLATIQSNISGEIEQQQSFYAQRKAGVERLMRE